MFNYFTLKNKDFYFLIFLFVFLNTWVILKFWIIYNSLDLSDYIVACSDISNQIRILLINLLCSNSNEKDFYSESSN